jgi:hypothetical protein
MFQSKKNKLVCLLLVTISLLIFVQVADAATMSFWVNKGQTETRSISLEVDDHVLIEFTVTGHGENALDFYLADPEGNMKVGYNSTGSVHYSFVCDRAGEYILHFSNTDSNENSFVTLNYEVEHYIFGIPQMLFLAIIVVLVCVGAVAVFILMGKPR